MDLFINLTLLTVSTALTITMILALNNFLIGNVPFVPSKKEAIQNMKLLADIKSGELVADLGSGDGRILINLSNSVPGAKFIGYEINKVLAIISRININMKKKSDDIEIINSDFLNEDLSKFDVIILYGIGRIMPIIEQKIKNECKKEGVRVISNTFELPHEKPAKTINKIHLYKF